MDVFPVGADPVMGDFRLRGPERDSPVADLAMQEIFQAILFLCIPLAAPRFGPQVPRVVRVAADLKGDQVILFVMTGINVGIAVLADLPLLEPIGVTGWRPDCFGVSLDADRGLDVLLRN